MVNWVDTISLIAWVAGAAIGLFSGFIKFSIPFAFLLVGVGIAGSLAVSFGPSLFGVLGAESAQLAAAFLIVFALLQLLGGVIAYLTRHLLGIASTLVSVTPMVGLLNRGGGLLAGFVYGCVFISVILISLQQWPVGAVAEGLQEATISYRPIAWVDWFVGSIEIYPE